MSPRLGIVLGAILALLAVAAGAFGAHGLKGKLDANSLQVFEVGVRYQMYHSLALILISMLGLIRPQLSLGNPLLAISIGILLFSGSLYGLSLFQWRWLGPITPLGGLSFLIGWGWLAYLATKID